MVSLEASPTSDYEFAGWTGDVGTIADVNDPTTTITMNGDYLITANFKNILTLNITPVLSEGKVTPVSGDISTSYIYSIKYTDGDNDSSSNISLYINENTPVEMTLRSGQDGDFTNGEIYEYIISGNLLGTGNHEFRYAASDGTDNATGDIKIHSGPIVTSPPPQTSGGDGGGDGGGGAVGEKMFTNLRGVTSNYFQLIEDVEALSIYGKVKVFLKEGTIAVNRVGSFILSIVIEKLVESPYAYTNREIIGSVYDIGPYGARFDPPVVLTIEYDEDSIPEGISENSLYIATWNEEKQEWERAECTLDTETDCINTLLDHFSIYTIMVNTRPADFELTDLIIAPTEVAIGEEVTISVIVNNTGDMTGSYEVTLILDDVSVASEEVTLRGGASQEVAFIRTMDTARTYSVTVADLSATFAVRTPAIFEVSDLTINPHEVEVGEEATITVLVSNTGDLSGSYEITLALDGVAVATEEVTLDGGISQEVAFIRTMDTTGTCSVKIANLSDTFEVTIPLKSEVTTVHVPVFTVSDLLITPAEVGAGDKVTISILVSNNSDFTDSFEVVLEIDNMITAKREITLAGKANQRVTFNTAKDVAGTYSVTVADLSGTFNVISAPMIIELSLVVIVIGTIFIIGFILWLLVFRRRA